ncbi:hypothetical protein [Polynucleobacter asymbioticus]|jgi:hypothetical protein|uniref:Uncharacterized protein n=1 Tax=Polynucleobacter asymbioticus TaxID=576611 RepID=A0AAC9IY56_9BURK|nr:hypothetical protein [Polynucleobacter asymbioticus]APB99035.1 hypothetical protein A4F89_06685 [Polynucleobacter asymbioticus]APC01337.1 hypothetical protein AOC25_06785 [Polynucleobacter asymbioticus]
MKKVIPLPHEEHAQKLKDMASKSKKNKDAQGRARAARAEGLINSASYTKSSISAGGAGGNNDDGSDDGD